MADGGWRMADRRRVVVETELGEIRRRIEPRFDEAPIREQLRRRRSVDDRLTADLRAPARLEVCALHDEIGVVVRAQLAPFFRGQVVVVDRVGAGGASRLRVAAAHLLDQFERLRVDFVAFGHDDARVDEGRPITNGIIMCGNTTTSRSGTISI